MTRWPWAALLLALTVALYLPALRSGTAFDDDVFVFENPLIAAPDGLLKLWFSTEPPDYFPLTSSMLWLEWRLWSADPFGYHLVNVLLHAFGCVLLGRALGRLGVPGAWPAALLFAVHPVNVETVAWITQRKNTLSFVLLLLSFLAWMRFEDLEGQGRSQRRAWLASLGWFLLALLSKTSVVILPPALLLCAWWRRGRVTARDLLRTAPFFGLAVALGLVTVWYQTYSNIGDEVVRSDGFPSRLALAGRAVWFYLGKAVRPLDLAAVYPRWVADVGLVATWLPLAALVVVFTALWVARRTRLGRPLLFALAFDVLALLPVLGFGDIYFMRYSLVADHWQHVALVAPVALAAAGLTRLGDSLALPANPWPLVAPLAAVLAVLSWRQQAAWRDDEALWTDTLAKNPSAWVAEYGLGHALDARGAVEEAVPHLQRALRLSPDHADAHFNLAHALVRLGRPEEALAHYGQVLRLQPAHADARNNLGVALHLLGRHEEAAACYEESLRLAPDDVPSRFNLGLAQQALGRDREAAAHFEQVLQRQPEHAQALARLSLLLATGDEGVLRDVPRAVALAERLLAMAGDGDVTALDTLAVAHAAAGRFDEAARREEQAVERAPAARQAELRARLELFRRGVAYRPTR